MKKLVALIATAILASLLLVIPATPASADTGVCAGVGNAVTGNPLYYPLLGPKTPLGTSFAFSFGILGGVCATDTNPVPGKTFSASGVVNGYCGLSSGRGEARGEGSDLEFWFVGIGGLLVVGGHISGVALAAPDAVFNSQSCLTGASIFIVGGGVVKNHVVPQDKPTQLLMEKFPPELPNLRAIVCAETGGQVCL